jgi:heme/copper-type cytochrome/quinol oxidase subunit 3
MLSSSYTVSVNVAAINSEKTGGVTTWNLHINKYYSLILYNGISVTKNITLSVYFLILGLFLVAKEKAGSAPVVFIRGA